MKRTVSGISFEQGEILLISFPFSGLSTTKKRPVLVLSKKRYNDSSSDFICCGITSNLDNKSHSVLIERNDVRGGSIPKTSRIKFNKIFTLEKSLVVKRLGRIENKKFHQVREALIEIV
jgi:mRNA interferase MazF